MSGAGEGSITLRVFMKGKTRSTSIGMGRDWSLSIAMRRARRKFVFSEQDARRTVLVWDRQVLPLSATVDQLFIPSGSRVEFRLFPPVSAPVAPPPSSQAAGGVPMGAAAWDAYHTLRPGEVIGFR